MATGLTATDRDYVARVQVSLTASLAYPDPNVTTPLNATAESTVAIRNRSLQNF